MCDEINSQNFLSEILRSEVSVVLDFFAPWCTSCRKLVPVLEEISEKYSGKIRVCRVNVDSESQLADKYGISIIPTVVFFRNGRQTDRFIGYRSAEEIEKMISNT